MIADGFQWTSDIEVKVEGFLLDLHAEYEFRSVTADVVKRVVILQWVRRSDSWIETTQPSKFILTLSDVDYFEVKPSDPELADTEDDCLGAFGYYCDEDWCTAPFWTETAPDEDWHWVFEFMSGGQIVVGGKRALAGLR